MYGGYQGHPQQQQQQPPHGSYGSPQGPVKAMYNGGVHPGRAGNHIPNGGFATCYGSEEIFLPEYEVLCGNAQQLIWVPQKDKLELDGIRPLQAGYEESGEPLYVGKTLYGKAQPIGKCGTHFKTGFIFAYDGKERKEDDYRVLAYAM
ncbi:hypothetical protein EV182_003010 [Spiromyces aspiralis]|uniref:Uncharacterized protein n=1 Tax=Spiromyces aspiralis TaxID=68401 RepID=A0ACC1HSF6_9FUNG|nr:hypothetical protein EV182_003010 [Spiromyces aspiralis]